MRDLESFGRRLGTRLEAECRTATVSGDAWSRVVAKRNRSSRLVVLGTTSIALALVAGLLAYEQIGTTSGGFAGRYEILAEEAGTARFIRTARIEVSNVPSGRRETISTWEGELDFRRELAHVVTTTIVTTEPPEAYQAKPCESVLSASAVWYRLTDEESIRRAGGPWLRVSRPRIEAFGSIDPRGLLQELRHLEAEGNDTVGGIQTTRYTGYRDFATGVEKLPPDDRSRARDHLARSTIKAAQGRLWLDDRGLVRRWREVSGGRGSPKFASEMTWEFFDYGASPSISVPSPDETVRWDDVASAAAACHGVPLGEGAGSRSP